MGVRETLNQKPIIGYSVAGGFVLLAIITGVWLASGKSPVAPTSAGKAFYSDDDGATYFSADATLIPPAPSPRDASKTAFRAFVYKCSDGKTFVGYLQRFSEKSREVSEVKKPKAKNWVSRSGGAQAGDYMAIVMPKCPSGEDAVLVDPNAP